MDTPDEPEAKLDLFFRYFYQLHEFTEREKEVIKTLYKDLKKYLMGLFNVIVDRQESEADKLQDILLDCEGISREILKRGSNYASKAAHVIELIRDILFENDTLVISQLGLALMFKFPRRDMDPFQTMYMNILMSMNEIVTYMVVCDKVVESELLDPFDDLFETRPIAIPVPRIYP